MRWLKWWHILAVSIVGLGLVAVGTVIFAPDLIRFCSLVDYLDSEDRLSVTITSPLPENYDVEVWYHDDKYTKFRCENGQLVGGDAVNTDQTEKPRDFGQNFTDICAMQSMSSRDLVKEFRLRITWLDDSYETTVRPDYQTHAPNGEGCEPTYRRAQIELTLE